MVKPRVLVFTGYGINCEEETAFAFQKAGAEAEVFHINDVIKNKNILDQFQIIAFPGGFSYGDDTGSGNAYAYKAKNNLWEELLAFLQKDKLMIGICNGCQILANLGLIPGLSEKIGKREIAFDFNDSATYECRWVTLKAEKSPCVFSQGIETLRVPVAHGEGKFFASANTLKKVEDQNLVVFRYIKENGDKALEEFPFNPNGSLHDIAAVCSPNGKVLGIMPHPERALSFYQLDQWPLWKEEKISKGRKVSDEGPGLKIFQNAVQYFN